VGCWEVGKFNSQDLALLRAGTGRLAKLLDIDLADVTLVSDGSAYSTVETDRYQIGLGMETTTSSLFVKIRIHFCVSYEGADFFFSNICIPMFLLS
jgi:hypothetical protein